MYIPPFTISAEAINLIAEISGQIERYAIRLEQEDGLRLRKVNRIKTIHSSLAIEGNTLSEDQVRDILDGKNVVAPLKEIQEVRNAITASTNAGQSGPFIDFMLNEIYKTLKSHQGEPLYDKLHDKVPNKIPNKVPNKLRNEFPDITDSTWDVFMLLNTTHTATAEEIAAALGISSRMVRKHIATLKGAGIIVRVGSNKTGHWQVINKENEEKSIQKSIQL
jgi:Fic family protein